jgi:hypothetical protein
MRSTSICLFLLFAPSCFAETFPTSLLPLPVSRVSLAQDLERIEKNANFPNATLSISVSGPSTKNTVTLGCLANKVVFQVRATPGEEAATFYKGLREVGFLFPHPRRQISPSLKEIKKLCNKVFTWRPAFKYRGHHLHTLHPSEWVHGFFMDKPEVADETVRWMARNGQNLLDISLLRLPLEEISRQLRPAFETARALQVHTGVSLGIALHQQKSYKLLSIFQSIFGYKAKESIQEGMELLFKNIPLSYIVMEAGTSEFTPTHYEKTLSWLNLAGKVARQHGKAYFNKVHVSSNQSSEKYGNYNFLPKFAQQTVGVLPHTVMFYGVVDPLAPMYGNRTFHDIRDFMLEEKNKRPTWYYPETSYWIGMDVDVPLLLTDYLKVRSEDMQFLYENKIEGQLNFTTGHGLGYWLFDWQVALMNDLDYKFDPLTALRLLGESELVWKKLMDYQHEWYKTKGLIAPLSAANLQDELSSNHRIHDRSTMKELSKNHGVLKREIDLLRSALEDIPNWDEVMDSELEALLTINWMRMVHALKIREALFYPENKKSYLDDAKEIRENAKGLIEKILTLQTNYPDLPLANFHNNPTGYQFGYIYPAASLYWWEREERQIREESYFPFKNNIYDIFKILL